MVISFHISTIELNQQKYLQSRRKWTTTTTTTVLANCSRSSLPFTLIVLTTAINIYTHTERQAVTPKRSKQASLQLTSSNVNGAHYMLVFTLLARIMRRALVWHGTLHCNAYSQELFIYISGSIFFIVNLLLAYLAMKGHIFVHFLSKYWKCLLILRGRRALAFIIL